MKLYVDCFQFYETCLNMHEGLLGKKAGLAVVASAESMLEPLAK
jgi:hypothetical protein